ncbi:alpha/beta fold hydrolase [uncultured Schumannella sp.]|uniref:alpha/beta fold hydrolase n=1 Tax=uncultured Schumannella sp. TaxID=1195956 RepID=UPI0025D4CD3E|nr:alpha/beta hydrolase [uncultured Schumannella sp.]
MDVSQSVESRVLVRPDARIAYRVAGDGPLVVAVPGMGDLASSYRDLASDLIAAGYRVAVTELRGHGASSADVAEQGDEATAGDIIALIDELGSPAVVIANSMGAAAAVLAAADRPELVRGLVLVGPVLRDAEGSAFAAAMTKLLLRVVLARPWGARLWSSMYRSYFHRGRAAAWRDAHADAIRASLDADHLRSFRALTQVLTHRAVTPRLSDVTVPALIVVGSLDPDYADPVAELEWMSARLPGRAELVEGVAHYPHVQAPELVTPWTLEYLASRRSDENWVGANA